MPGLFDVVVPFPFSTDAAFEKLRDNYCDAPWHGTSRMVYPIRGTSFVLKEALDKDKVICNWIEITAFLKNEEDRAKLARVQSWSESGKFMVMERLDMDERPDAPFDFPAWVNDRKPSSVGKAQDGIFKMCDYAYIVPPDTTTSSSFGGIY